MRNNLPTRFVRRLGSVLPSTPSHGPTFSESLLSEASDSQRALLSHFKESYDLLPEIPLKQSMFNKGTLRITKPGKYVLKENIIFNPETQFPTPEQFAHYPVGKNGPYHLGFFAAIAIEAPDVILDLRGHTITQSKRHNLLQRFFSVIELANSPFIPKQGPHSFIDNFMPTSKCLIMNGCLNNSSHHGIHGNRNRDIVIHNVKMTDFEVAAVALNGSSNSIISDCVMVGKKQGIKVLSSFSQSIFTERAMVNLKETSSIEYSNLDRDLQTTFREIMNNQHQTTYFENKTGQYDGNMYGIVLNVAGIVVHDFLEERKPEHINDDILIFNTSIKDIETHPVEILGLPLSKANPSSSQAYGGKVMVGAFGDVFDIEKVMNRERKYEGNSLSDAQLYLAKTHPKHGSINIEKRIIDWAKSDTPIPSNQQFTPLGDSMAHVMKGNIGVFISGGKNIKLASVTIDNVKTTGHSVGTSPLLREDQRYFKGSNVYGVLTTATAADEIKMSQVTIKNITSETEKAIQKKIEVL
jgi:hypothetical protein